jgi:hypothetical protein
VPGDLIDQGTEDFGRQPGHGDQSVQHEHRDDQAQRILTADQVAMTATLGDRVRAPGARDLKK